MDNPIIKMLAGQMPQSSNLKNMVGMMKSAKNPQAMLNQMASQNPQMKTILDMVQGRNPKQVFLDACREKGKDPNDILSMLQ